MTYSDDLEARLRGNRGLAGRGLRLGAMIVALAAGLMSALGSAHATPVRTENVEAEFFSARAAIAPGETFTIVLRQRIAEGWHTYWRNPGDSGEPTEVTWRLPAGFSAGEIQWPAPEAIPFAILVNYGFSGEVLYPIEITAPRNLPVGRDVTLTADLYWLVCSDICIPEEGVASFNVAVAAQGRDDPIWAPRIAAAVAALPQRFEGDAHISAGAPATLSIALPGGARDAHFFPYSRDAIDHAAPQQPSSGPNGLSFSLTPGAADNLGSGPLEGVLTLETASGEKRAYEVDARPGPPLPGTSGSLAAPANSAAAPLALPALLAALGFAFLGGLILNIMPCVLPVLSVKALSFAGGVQAGRARRDGLLYGAGVLATFLALAGLLIVLRGAGEAVGWGFQFQSPFVTSALALLFFAVGLNLFGVFEFGGSVQNAGADLANKGGDAGSFFTGALAVVAATPCTAPFMAGAIGATLTQSAGVTLLVFAALAVGFALPLMLLHFAPGLQRLLPKPGAWMERVKQVLAFPMFAAAIWLVWVLAQQSGAGGVAAVLALTLALGFALYVARWGRVWLAAGLLALAITGAMAWRPLSGEAEQGALAIEPWSPERVAALRAEGRPVFVDFTAAWCVTCKVNEATSIMRPRVAAAFAAQNAAFLQADWTNRDAAIAAELEAHGRAGVPLYLFYAPGQEAIVLPQVLSEDLMIRTLQGDAP